MLFNMKVIIKIKLNHETINWNFNFSYCYKLKKNKLNCFFNIIVSCLKKIIYIIYKFSHIFLSAIKSIYIWTTSWVIQPLYTESRTTWLPNTFQTTITNTKNTKPDKNKLHHQSKSSKDIP